MTNDVCNTLISVFLGALITYIFTKINHEYESKKNYKNLIITLMIDRQKLFSEILNAKNGQNFVDYSIITAELNRCSFIYILKDDLKKCFNELLIESKKVGEDRNNKNIYGVLLKINNLLESLEIGE